MSSFNADAVRELITAPRLSSYASACGGDLDAALQLYDWNVLAGGVFHEVVGRLEVVLRNALDRQLVDLGTRRGWAQPWYLHPDLFPGRHGRRAAEDIATARSRVSRGGGPERHGSVVAELTFGFWRYLCTRPYLTSLWVPALVHAFPGHPATGDARVVRAAVDDHVQRLWFLRNRLAHHEPLHARDLDRDHAQLLEVAGWISDDAAKWIENASRWDAAKIARP